MLLYDWRFWFGIYFSFFGRGASFDIIFFLDIYKYAQTQVIDATHIDSFNSFVYYTTFVVLFFLLCWPRKLIIELAANICTYFLGWTAVYLNWNEQQNFKYLFTFPQPPLLPPPPPPSYQIGNCTLKRKMFQLILFYSFRCFA